MEIFRPELVALTGGQINAGKFATWPTLKDSRQMLLWYLYVN
jgi:hypothetical protein